MLLRPMQLIVFEPKDEKAVFAAKDEKAVMALAGTSLVLEEANSGQVLNQSFDAGSASGLIKHSGIRKKPHSMEYLRERFALDPTSVMLLDPQAQAVAGVKWLISPRRNQSPILLFVNKKSGGGRAKGFAKTIKKDLGLHACQVWQMLDGGGPRAGLEQFKDMDHTIVVMGGDGSVVWVMMEMDKVDYKVGVRPPLIALPVGTGNDLARALGLGGGVYGTCTILNILKSIQYGEPQSEKGLDRWALNFKPHSTSEVPVNLVFNNYFSIGADARVCYKFDADRNARRWCYKLQTTNKLWYGVHSMSSMFSNPDIRKVCQLTVDGVHTAVPRGMECLILLNIPSYAGGTDPWGPVSRRDLERGFKPQACDDGVLEVVGMKSLVRAGLLQVGLGQGEKVAQARKVRLHILDAIYGQIDGEPIFLTPGVVTIERLNQYTMHYVPPQPVPLLSVPSLCSCCFSGSQDD